MRTSQTPSQLRSHGRKEEDDKSIHRLHISNGSMFTLTCVHVLLILRWCILEIQALTLAFAQSRLTAARESRKDRKPAKWGAKASQVSGLGVYAG